MSNQIHLYNSLSHQLEPFTPLDPNQVTMYVCGPTVYNYVHIGNARGPVVFDVLSHLLRRHYPAVRYARNITDIDDKINTAAHEQGVSIDVISERFTQAYREDMAKLGVSPPDVEPTATGHMNEMIQMIDGLIQRGHAYVANHHVLFSVSSYPQYGALSRKTLTELKEGARVEIAPYKKDAGDFVLWKPSEAHQPGWPSPWGVGRPGWHIECSAMCASVLGPTIDIHAGGLDLQFPHHENEIAQSTCAHGGAPFARYWLHNNMLNLDGGKMSKSVGNVHRLRDVLSIYPAEAVRLALLSAHYRQPLEWKPELIQQSISTLNGLYQLLADLGDVESADPTEVPVEIEQALMNDLDTPAALSALHHFAAQARDALLSQDQQKISFYRSKIKGAGVALGLLKMSPGLWFTQGVDPDKEHQIQELIDHRRRAKEQKDWALADEIRQKIQDLGVVLEDTPTGVRWKVKR